MGGEIQAFIDVAFVVAVVIFCIKHLLGERTERKGLAWRGELRELEGMMRELIAEAGAAGNNLNRSLLKRKDELNVLLQQIETKAEKLSSAAELPNETWKPIAKKPALQKSLNKQIEILAEQNKPAPLEIPPELAHWDDTTFRIARRLLLERKEIHAVARKLSLPLAEVRMLDSTLRVSDAGADQDLPGSALPAAPSTKTNALRAKTASAGAPQRVNTVVGDADLIELELDILDREIDRGSALL